MINRFSAASGGLLLAASALFIGSVTPTPDRASVPVRSQDQASNLMAALPIAFESNAGQADPEVRYLARTPGMTAYLTEQESVMVLSRRKPQLGSKQVTETEHAIVRMTLSGARRPSSFAGSDEIDSRSNYFIGRDPSKWVTNIPNYAKVSARQVYSGIDLVFHGDGRHLEFDFVVEPGADPGQIHIAYTGTESLSVDADGNLLIGTPLGPLVQRKPKVYQESDTGRREIAGSYRLRGGGVEFALGEWDRSKTLVIDPVMVYSTFLGGPGSDVANAVTVDPTGAAYIVGGAAPGFPTLAGGYKTTTTSRDVFVTKLTPAGDARVYSTYIGGSLEDAGYGIVVDGDGNAYVVGNTGSLGTFPITTGSTCSTNFDAFALKLNSTGSALLFSRCIGGSSEENGRGIALHWDGGVFVTGHTASAGFPTTTGAAQTVFGGANDAFVARLDAAGGMIYSTFVGGTGDDRGYGVAVDSTGAAWITGSTRSANFPVTAGAVQPTFGGGTNVADAFVAKIAPDGSAVSYGTYLGGNRNDEGRAIAIGTGNTVFAVGLARDGFPTSPGVLRPTGNTGNDDAFVVKLTNAGSSVYSTFLGGNMISGVGAGTDQAWGVAVDCDGKAWVVGVTSSGDFPTTTGAVNTVYGGAFDAFVTQINETGTAVLYSTFLGGAGEEYAYGVALGADGSAIATGYTASTAFPTTAGAFQPSHVGGNDAFLTRFSSAAPAPASTFSLVSGTPQSTPASSAFPNPLRMSVTDSLGKPVAGVPIIFTPPASGASATFPATTVVSTCIGVASLPTANSTFGEYVVNATALGSSLSFNLKNTATAIAFVDQPANTVAGAVMASITVRLTAGTNPVTNTPVTLSVKDGAATLSGVLTANTDATGVATFTGLSMTQAGTYQLVATGAELTTDSALFTISAAAPSSIAFIQQPTDAAAGVPISPSVTVQLKDEFGNPVPSGSVALILQGAAGPLVGTLTQLTDASGIATFSDLSVSSGGTYTLQASANGSNTVSDQFQITGQEPQPVPAATTPSLVLTGLLIAGLGVYLRKRAASADHPGAA